VSSKFQELDESAMGPLRFAESTEYELIPGMREQGKASRPDHYHPGAARLLEQAEPPFTRVQSVLPCKLWDVGRISLELERGMSVVSPPRLSPSARQFMTGVDQEFRCVRTAQRARRKPARAPSRVSVNEMPPSPATQHPSHCQSPRQADSPSPCWRS
jgi:hypothetical protein